MASIYKFKLSFEDYEDIYRVIEIQSTTTFLDLHKIILKSINFDEKQLASFYMSNDTWKKFDEITLEDMSDDPEKPKFEMKKTRLCDRINDPHQKIIYIYDFIELWTMHLEMTGIDVKEKAGVEYPRITKTAGLAPKQYDKVQRFGVIDDNEFDEITKNYLNKTDDIGGEISDDEADEHGLFEDEAEEGADENSFIEE
ncbi:MAG: hypothetical protein EBZ58_12355 [Bacteroidetes bacterium]|jgi:hypothetical protein|nr:hypothetical protein [Bacteroidota bacterium]